MSSLPAQIEIRPLESSDVDAVVGLLVAQLREHAIPCREEHVARSLRGILAHADQGTVLVAASDGSAVGVAYVSFAHPLEHEGEVAWLEELYVAPEQRDRGIGTRLLQQVAAMVDARGCVSLELEVKRGHERVVSLYEREGFRDLTRMHFAKPLRAWDWR
jgi:GNAT superfamily N-acetyltransferase